MSLWAFGNIFWVWPLQLACFVQSFFCICIAVMSVWFSVFGLTIFYLTLFLVAGFFSIVLTVLAGCSCMNVWYGAPVPESYLDAVARAFTQIDFAVWMVSLFFGMSTLIAPRA